MYVVLLGAPGAGKGTQAAMLSERLGLPHISTGNIFRAALANNTRLGQLAKPYMESGQLVPDDITTQMVVERLTQADAREGALLDGFPRTVEQARALDAALAEQGLKVDRAVSIEVDREELIRRLTGRRLCRDCQTPYHVTEQPPKVPGICDQCGGELYQRTDDQEETVRKRLDVYAKQTAPLVDYYRAKGALVEVNGQQPIEAVLQDMLKAVKRD